MYLYFLCDLEVYLKYTFQIDVFLFKPRRIPEVDFLQWCIYFQTQKYTFKICVFKFKLRSIQDVDFPNLCFSFQEVYLKRTFIIDVFILKIRSILEVDFLNLCIYDQTQSIFEVDSLYNVFLFILRSILEV